MSYSSHAFFRTVYVLRKFLRTRLRLLTSIIAGLVIGMILPTNLSAVTRCLIGWNVIVWCYLGLIGWLMSKANHVLVRRMAEQEDKGAVAILAVMSMASIVSIAAIVLELANMKGVSGGHKLLHYGFTAATVFGSWCLVSILFTFHYARLFYSSPPDQRALSFPDNLENLDYWDFLYFSFTVAVTFQTSDVAIMSRSVRKTVLAQSILSFLFNIAIFGLSINIAAGLIDS